MIFAFDDCELDTALYELRRGGRPCRVEPQVLDLLFHLVRNPERLVTKDELYETIWKGRIVSESTLSAGISAARRAIGDDGARAGRIRTVFRRGFRFAGAVTVREAPDEATPPVAYLCGHFVCYSHAWSPAFEGKLLRGSLVIEPRPAPSTSLGATYSESLPNATLRHCGPVSFSERTMYLDLHDRRADSRVLLALLCPSLPATALVGVMSGKVFHDPNSEIAVTRLVAVRVPGVDLAMLDSSNRYLDPTRDSVSKDLNGLGLPLSPSPELDSLLGDFLMGKAAGGFFRVTAADNQAVNVGLDRALASPS